MVPLFLAGIGGVDRGLGLRAEKPDAVEVDFDRVDGFSILVVAPVAELADRPDEVALGLATWASIKATRFGRKVVRRCQSVRSLISPLCLSVHRSLVARLMVANFLPVPLRTSTLPTLPIRVTWFSLYIFVSPVCAPWGGFDALETAEHGGAVQPKPGGSCGNPVGRLTEQADCEAREGTATEGIR